MQSKVIENPMNIIAVTNAQHIREFLELPVRLYQNDTNWVRPLNNDIEKVFDPKVNKYFQHGAAQRWILQTATGLTIGRVAAFINDKTKDAENEQPTGGMGFFECIHDQKAAFLLFDTCREWLRERGMEAMDGPINFGERDNWWGLLVEGFDMPNYGMNYNPPYYQEFFEAYGFSLYFKQFSYRRMVNEPLNPRVVEIGNKHLKNPDYHFTTIKKSELEKFAEDFRTVYNKAWVKHAGIREMSSAQAQNIMNQMKPLLEEELVVFAYYKNEPIGFYIHILDLNQFLKTINGTLNLWEKIKFVLFKTFKRFDRIIGVVFGVVPEQQKRGVEMSMIAYFSKIAFNPKFQYNIVDMKWIGDFNPKMMRVAEMVGGRIHRTHITYRYLFDRNKVCKRSPMIE